MLPVCDRILPASAGRYLRVISYTPKWSNTITIISIASGEATIIKGSQSSQVYFLSSFTSPSWTSSPVYRTGLRLSVRFGRIRGFVLGYIQWLSLVFW